MSLDFAQGFERAFCDAESHKNHYNKVHHLINAYRVLVMTVSGMSPLGNSKLNDMAATYITYMKTCTVLKRQSKEFTDAVSCLYVEFPEDRQEDQKSQEK